MATIAADPVFVDSNILVQAAVRSAPHYIAARAALHQFRQAGVELWVSRQVLREYLATLSRPQTYTRPLAASLLVADVAQFQNQFRVAEDGPTVTVNLLSLLSTISIGGRQVHDANIVATMQAHGLRRLLTHNTGDFARFASIIDVLPL